MSNESRDQPAIPVYRGYKLDDFQRKAIEAIARNESVIVAAPTGAGKTLIAEYALDRALQEGKRIIYTSPIKALSNQKYRDFTKLYPGKIGITTGDVSVNPDAPALIMTTEIFRNTIFENPQRLADVSYVIFDEIHYMDDRERGTVWEESLIFAPEEIRLLALSATVSNLDEMTHWLQTIRPGPLEVIVENNRPVPLKIFMAKVGEPIRPFSKDNFRKLKARHRHAERQKIDSIPERVGKAHASLVEAILQRDELPCLFFLFSRNACERLADKCSHLDLFKTQKEREAALAHFDSLCRQYRLDSRDPMKRTLRRLLHNGITFHHAGLLPVFKEIIEQLFSAHHIRLLFATETFALGVNMPARSVAFEGIKKFDGRGRVPLETRQFMQMAGRAGRRGLDKSGSVYIHFDPVLDDPRTAIGIVKGKVEPVRSQFNLSYATLLNLYRHLGFRIFEACERSFANFSKHQSKSKQRKKKDHFKKHRRRRNKNPVENEGRSSKATGFEGRIEQVRRKLKLLSELGYLNLDPKEPSDRLTEKGEFACLIYGCELTATELLYEGTLDHLGPEQLAVVFTALVYESRTDAIAAPFDMKRVFGKTFRRINRIISQVHEMEQDSKIHDTSRTIDWGLSGVVWAWARGEDFNTLRSLTNVSDGDIVRNLRQALQLMRMVGFPLRKKTHDPLQLRLLKTGQRIHVAIDLLKRDLVDAEWQLRIQEEDAHEELEVQHSDHDSAIEPDIEQDLEDSEEDVRDKKSKQHSNPHLRSLPYELPSFGSFDS